MRRGGGATLCHSSAGGLGAAVRSVILGVVCGAICHGALPGCARAVERAAGSSSLRLPRIAGAARTTSARGGEEAIRPRGGASTIFPAGAGSKSRIASSARTGRDRPPSASTITVSRRSCMVIPKSLILEGIIDRMRRSGRRSQRSPNFWRQHPDPVLDWQGYRIFIMGKRA